MSKPFLSPLGGAGWQFFNDTGTPLSGGKLYTYIAGTTTPLATYADDTGNVFNSNPIILNSAGRIDTQIWMDSNSTIKFVLKNLNDVTLWTEDNIRPILTTAAFENTNGASLIGFTPYEYISATNVQNAIEQSIGFTQFGNDAISNTVQNTIRSLTILTPEQFGAIGDGVANDNTAMQALGNAARSLGAVRIKLTAGKTYTYTNPLFLTGVKDALIIDGWGATLQNIRASVLGPSATYANNEGLVFYPIFFGLGRTLIGTVSPQYFYGEAIDTVARGSSTITVSSGGSMADFVVGNRVMVYGFGVQVGGFPSTARYFEYATITSIVGNVLTLDRPLKYAYSTDWPSLNPSATFTGKPRVISMCYNQAQETAYLEINGVHLKADPGWTVSAGGTINRNGRLSVGSYKNCVLNGVVGDGGMYVFQGQHFADNGSKFNGEIEIDKYIETAVMNGVDYGSYSQGTGCKLIRFQNGSLIRAYGNGDALEKFEIVDSEILSGGIGVALLLGTFGTPYTLLQRTRLNKVTANLTLKSDTRLANAYTYVSATRLDMASSDYTGTNLHRVLNSGSTLYNATGQSVFRLTDTPKEAAGRVYFDGVFLGGSFTSGNTLYTPLYPVVQADQIIVQQDGSAVEYLPAVINPNVEPLFATKLDSRSTLNRWWEGGLRKITNSSNYLQLANSVRVSQIVISVERAYTGVTTPAVLRVRRLGGGGTNIALIDLTTVGVRTLEVAGNFGATAGDTLTGIGTAPIPVVEYFTTGAIVYASDDEAPIFYITVNGQRIGDL